MIPASVVPAVLVYLQSAIGQQLDTDPAASTIGLYLGELPTTDLPNDVVAIGNVTRTVVPETFVGSGAQFWLNEKFTVAVTCSSWSGDNDGTAAMSRAWELVGYVEMAVRLDPSLGGQVNRSYPSQSKSPGPQFTESPVGMGCAITESIFVENLN